MSNQMMPFHATIITGSPDARQKKALRMAQALVCSGTGAQKPCGLCRDCRKAAEGIHPDVIPVERFMEEKDFGGEIKIGPVRALRNDTFIRPNEAECKVYLIDNAQNLNLNAQNALLKLLEEGPAYAVFLLLTDRSGALLETILSRCAQLNAGEDTQAVEIDSKALELARIVAGADELERAAFLSRLECAKPDKAALDCFLTGLEDVFTDAALGGVTGRFQTPEAQALSNRRSRGALLELAASVREARNMTAFHVGAGHLLGWLGTRL